MKSYNTYVMYYAIVFGDSTVSLIELYNYLTLYLLFVELLIFILILQRKRFLFISISRIIKFQIKF